jgi:hypothetical protein
MLIVLQNKPLNTTDTPPATRCLTVSTNPLYVTRSMSPFMAVLKPSNGQPTIATIVPPTSDAYRPEDWVVVMVVVVVVVEEEEEEEEGGGGQNAKAALP